MIQLYAHIKAIGNKLLLFQRHLTQREPNTTHFPALREVIKSFSQENISAQRRSATDIASLAGEFKERFQDFAAIKKDLLLFYSHGGGRIGKQQKEKLRINCSWSSFSFFVTTRHQQFSLVNFHPQLDKGSFPEMWAFAKKMLSLFGSTHLCEQTLSVMNLNKNRLRSRQSGFPLLYVTFYASQPLVSNQSRSQYHPSH